MEIIVGTAIGAIVLYLWGWRRIRYVQWYFGRAKRAEKFERSLRDAREDVTGRCPYRQPAASDSEVLSLLPDDRELIAAGFVPLGDLVIQYSHKPASGAARCYADAAGTTFAMWIATHQSRAGIPRLASYAGDRIFVTARQPFAVLAAPPFVTRQMLDAGRPIAEMLQRHRTFVADHPLLRLATLDELLARLAMDHERIVAWRAAQPPDELLDADLKCVLGDLYPRAGKAWARRLRGKLPEARLHS